MIDRATRNLAGVVTVQANYLNVYDIMNADIIVVSEPALEVIQAWLGEAKAAKPKVEKVKSQKSVKAKVESADLKAAKKAPVTKKETAK